MLVNSLRRAAAPTHHSPSECTTLTRKPHPVFLGNERLFEHRWGDVTRFCSKSWQPIWHAVFLGFERLFEHQWGDVTRSCSKSRWLILIAFGGLLGARA